MQAQLTQQNKNACTVSNVGMMKPNVTFFGHWTQALQTITKSDCTDIETRIPGVTSYL